MVEPHKIGGAVILRAGDGENHCGTRLFQYYGADQKCIKSSTKNRLFVFTKHGQKVDKMRVKTVPKTGIMVQVKDNQNASNFGGVSMATSWESVDVGCPFYRASDGVYIRCEGLAGLTMTICFSDKQRKAVLMERYCNCRWEDCPFHKEVAAQYEQTNKTQTKGRQKTVVWARVIIRIGSFLIINRGVKQRRRILRQALDDLFKGWK